MIRPQIDDERTEELVERYRRIRGISLSQAVTELMLATLRPTGLGDSALSVEHAVTHVRTLRHRR
jgi:uncharacterized membrane protein